MRFIFWSAKASQGRSRRKNDHYAAKNKCNKGLVKKVLYILMMTILAGNFAASLYIWRNELTRGIGWGLKQAYLYVFSTENERIIQFVKDNYLYFSQVENFEEKAEAFRKLKNINSEDVKEYIQSVKIPEDIYTFVKIQSQYQGYVENERTPQVAMQEIKKGVYHISVRSFTQNSHKEFSSMIKSISSPKDATLIIDLRNNGGGSTTAVNKIADLLLPYCVTNYEVDRNGKVFAYFSGNSSIKFKAIDIFVNSNSASASEVLALALKSYGNNVRIIGTDTKGKGVGQTTFENKKKQYIIYLVQHFWNSRERNIMKAGIKPDIKVNSEDDGEFYQKAYGL